MLRILCVDIAFYFNSVSHSLLFTQVRLAGAKLQINLLKSQFRCHRLLTPLRFRVAKIKYQPSRERLCQSCYGYES